MAHEDNCREPLKPEGVPPIGPNMNSMLRPCEELPIRVLWLDEPETADPNLAGGKAAALARMTHRYPVPPAFVLPWTVFGEDGRLLVDGLDEAYGRLSADSVAVRSSAVGEDGRDASFAGQHATILHVRDREALRAAIYACWQSAHSEAALLYRARRTAEQAERPRISVLVQAMVRADAAAVGFSRAPAGYGIDLMLINATLGLGESLVSGEVTPDVIAVSRADLSIVRHEIAEKGRMSVMADEGVVERSVPRRLQHRPALDEIQVRDLARMMQALEEEWDMPVDVEACWDAHGLHLLQCRPITAV